MLLIESQGDAKSPSQQRYARCLIQGGYCNRLNRGTRFRSGYGQTGERLSENRHVVGEDRALQLPLRSRRGGRVPLSIGFGGLVVIACFVSSHFLSSGTVSLPVVSKWIWNSLDDSEETALPHRARRSDTSTGTRARPARRCRQKASKPIVLFRLNGSVERRYASSGSAQERPRRAFS